MDFLVKFFYIILKILGQSSSLAAKTGKAFFTSFNMLCKHIDHESSYLKYIVCLNCNQIYHLQQCIYSVGLQQYSKKCSFVEFPNHPHIRRRQPCGFLLLRTVEISSRLKKMLLPFKVYCYQSLEKSLKRLLSRQEFILNSSLWKHQETRSSETMQDIYDGKLWKEFRQYKGSSFLDQEYSFAFILNVDWFQPYTHTQTSIGVIYLTVLNLPRFLRYKLENVILVGIIPGPHEPKKSINSFLQPLIDELLKLWDGMLLPVHTSTGIDNKLVKGALLCISCDLSAAQKTCGFLGHSANLSCPKCLKMSPGEIGKKDYSGFDRSSWPKRDNTQHRRAVKKIQRCKTITAQKEMERKEGCRYSCLLDLPYFDATRMLCIDPMHNLFLGTGKHMISLWIEEGWLTKQHFKAIQQFIDSLVLPSDVGRIPHKIESGFSSFKADQFKSWITIYSIPALYNLLPTNHLECWRHFVLACRILCKHSWTTTELEVADILLLKFCARVQEIYGKDAVTPNMHLHCHLKEVLLDFGPAQEFWLFSFERYNGILGKQSTNNRAIEEQLMKKFIRNNLTYSYDFPRDYYHQEFSHILVGDKFVGSVQETLTPIQFALPNKYVRDGFDPEEISLVQNLLKKINSLTESDQINVNSVFLKYSSLTHKGKTFSSSFRQLKGPCIVQAHWNEDFYGSSPTSLPEPLQPTSNVRPVRVRFYCKIHYTIESKLSSVLLASVSWLKPHPQ